MFALPSQPGRYTPHPHHPGLQRHRLCPDTTIWNEASTVTAQTDRTICNRLHAASMPPTKGARDFAQGRPPIPADTCCLSFFVACEARMTGGGRNRPRAGCTTGGRRRNTAPGLCVRRRVCVMANMHAIWGAIRCQGPLPARSRPPGLDLWSLAPITTAPGHRRKPDSNSCISSRRRHRGGSCADSSKDMSFGPQPMLRWT